MCYFKTIVIYSFYSVVFVFCWIVFNLLKPMGSILFVMDHGNQDLCNKNCQHYWIWFFTVKWSWLNLSIKSRFMQLLNLINIEMTKSQQKFKLLQTSGCVMEDYTNFYLEVYTSKQKLHLQNRSYVDMCIWVVFWL